MGTEAGDKKGGRSGETQASRSRPCPRVLLGVVCRSTPQRPVMLQLLNVTSSSTIAAGLGHVVHRLGIYAPHHLYPLVQLDHDGRDFVHEHVLIDLNACICV